MPTATRDNPNQGRVYDVNHCSSVLTRMDGGGRQPMIFIDMNENPKTTNVARALIARYNAGLTRHAGVNSGVAIPVLTPDRINKRQNGRRFKEDGDPSFTLTAQDKHSVMIEKDREYRIRRLTPKECWRLQGFPDWAFNRAQEAGLSDTQLYKQAENSVTVDVIHAIAERMEKA